MSDAAPISTRDCLLTSGAEVFAERGYQGGSIRDICKRADASANMAHHYFGNKAGLLNAIVAQFSDRVLAVPMRLLQTPARSRDDLVSRIEMLFATTLDVCLDQRAVLMVVVQEQAAPPALSEYTARFIEFLDQAKRRGLVRQDLDTDMLTGAMFDRIISQVMFANRIESTFGVGLSQAAYKERWCASNVDLFLNGTLPPPERSEA